MGPVLASTPVDAEQALADLMEISSQVERAVVLDGEGGVAAASTASREGAERMARAAREAMAAAETVRPGAPVAQLEASTRAGTLFVVREAGRTIAATTGCSPTAGLVLYDLRTCLRTVDRDEA
jgi:predicted regulator of Ras-like GTPase activity (Roadblock/LC7/MglB family)